MAAALKITRAEVDGAAHSYSALRARILAAADSGVIALNLSAVTAPTTDEIAVLARAIGDADARNLTVSVTGWSDELIDSIQKASAALLTEEAGQRPHESMLERVGEKTLMVAHDWEGEGEYLWSTFNAIAIDPWLGKPWRWDAIIEQLFVVGVRGSGIVIFISILIGIVLALNGASQLRQFGAAIYIANLVGVAVCREMGPLITAVIVGGRSGSAMAAELGTMVVAEEIDAMRTMAMEPSRFLVAPRVIAMVVAMPCLTVVSDLMACWGGFLVGISMQLGASNYLRQTSQAILVTDVLVGLLKAVVYGALMALISCYEGLQVSGGAQGVGVATTRAVVSSIIACIAADAIFTLVFYFTT
jgi:phospholipid/cholesterol/gamma-HCH transport system permease protein